jgi:hypothetical protein
MINILPTIFSVMLAYSLFMLTVEIVKDKRKR